MRLAIEYTDTHTHTDKCLYALTLNVSLKLWKSCSAYWYKARFSSIDIFFLHEASKSALDRIVLDTEDKHKNVKISSEWEAHRRSRHELARSGSSSEPCRVRRGLFAYVICVSLCVWVWVCVCVCVCQCLPRPETYWESIHCEVPYEC